MPDVTPSAAQPEELELDEPGDSVEPNGPVAAAATASMARSRGGLVRVMRWLVRGVLLVLCVACAAVGWWGRQPGGKSTSGQQWDAVVTLDEGAAYGEAVVYIGDPTNGKAVADDTELQQAIAAALPAAGSPRVLVKAAPGVDVGAVDRVRRLVLAARPGQTVEVTLGLYEPPAAGAN